MSNIKEKETDEKETPQTIIVDVSIGQAPNSKGAEAKHTSSKILSEWDWNHNIIRPESSTLFVCLSLV